MPDIITDTVLVYIYWLTLQLTNSCEKKIIDHTNALLVIDTVLIHFRGLLLS